MVYHAVDVFPDSPQLQHGPPRALASTHPKMSEMMAVLPGFKDDTALQVYRYDSSGPN